MWEKGQKRLDLFQCRPVYMSILYHSLHLQGCHVHQCRMCTDKSVTCKGNFHITDIVNWHFITAFTWKIKYPIQSKLLYYDNFITDGSKAHGCYRAGLLWLTARVIISSNDDLLFSDFQFTFLVVLSYATESIYYKEKKTEDGMYFILPWALSFSNRCLQN